MQSFRIASRMLSRPIRGPVAAARIPRAIPLATYRAPLKPGLPRGFATATFEHMAEHPASRNASRALSIPLDVYPLLAVLVTALSAATYSITKHLIYDRDVFYFTVNTETSSKARSRKPNEYLTLPEEEWLFWDHL